MEWKKMILRRFVILADIYIDIEKFSIRFIEF